MLSFREIPGSAPTRLLGWSFQPLAPRGALRPKLGGSHGVLKGVYDVGAVLLIPELRNIELPRHAAGTLVHIREGIDDARLETNCPGTSLGEPFVDRLE